MCRLVPFNEFPAGARWPWGRKGHGPSKFLKSSDNCRTFAVDKDKSFEFYLKLFELGSSYFTGVTTPLAHT